MSKHTPGPWEAYNENEGMDMAYGPLWCVSDERYHNPPGDDSGYCFQAQINCGCEGDARLIAAAPDLLDGLKFLYRAYVNTLEAGRDRIISLGGECDPVDQMERGDPALIQTRALIAKATGEDHD